MNITEDNLLIIKNDSKRVRKSTAIKLPPEISESISNEPVLHLPISLKTPCWSCSLEAITTDSTFEPDGESIDKVPSGSPEIYIGTEAKVSPSALLAKNNSKNAHDRNNPIFFIFVTLIFDAVVPNLIAYIM